MEKNEEESPSAVISSALDNAISYEMQGNGLLLLSLPTGIGKSYCVANYINEIFSPERASDLQKVNKIFYLTGLIKNLPSEDLFNECVIDQMLRVPSYVNGILDGFEEHPEFLKDSNIVSFLKEAGIYDAITYYVQHNHKGKGKSDPNVRDFLSHYEKQVEDKEKDFRRKIKKHINANVRRAEKEEMPADLQRKKEYVLRNMPWVGVLYPTFYLDDKKFYVMTWDKFINVLDPIIRGGIVVFNNGVDELLKDSIIFIDEIDATQKISMKYLAKKARNSRIDCVTVFRTIYNRLNDTKEPIASYITSDKEAGRKIRYLTKRAGDIFDEYHVGYTFKSDETLDKNNSFMFRSHSSINMSSNNGGCLFYGQREDSCTNKIFNTMNASLEKDDKNLSFMARTIEEFLNGVFLTTITSIAVVIQKTHGISWDEAVSSALEIFFPDHEVYVHYFADRIYGYRSFRKDKDRIFDSSVYERGFSYSIVEDNDKHKTRSSIMLASMNSMGENILLKLCEHSKVIGISATTLYNTPIGNYAMQDYIIPKLMDESNKDADYYTLDDAHQIQIKAAFDRFNKGYSSVAIKCMPFASIADMKCYSEDSWKLVFQCDDDCRAVYDKLKSISDYDVNRYFKLSQAFKLFIEHDDIMSYLCLLNKRVGVLETNTFRKDIICDIYNRLAIQAGKQGRYKEQVKLLYGDNFDFYKEKVLNDLAQGKKRLVITTYNTSGSGQNLQYKIPKTMKDKIVHINNAYSYGEKDFDGIYLEKPAFVFDQLWLKQDTEEENNIELIKFIAQIERMGCAEILTGGLSYKEAREFEKWAFTKWLNRKSMEAMPSSISDILCARAAMLRILQQGIGRLCRTNRKSKNIYIGYDKDIEDAISLNERMISNNLDVSMINPEFRVLLDKLLESTHSVKENTMDEEKYVSKAKSLSRELYESHKHFLSGFEYGWDEFNRDLWEKMRVAMLRNPTVSDDKRMRLGLMLRSLYMMCPYKTNRIWFMQEDDYRNVDFSFENAKTKGYQELSAESARLDKFMQIPCVKEVFEREGYATSWEVNDFIMLPMAFTCYYKGALGEVAGRAIFEDKDMGINVHLQEITNPLLFERFDYEIPGTDVYVDFKHWRQRFNDDADKEFAHIFDKLKECCEITDKTHATALVVNIFPEEAEAIKDYPEKRIDPENPSHSAIVVPYLYDENGGINFTAFDKIREVIASSRI